VTWDLALGCLAAGLVIAALTTPVGVSGRGNIAPDWPVGLLCGLGGLADGYLGAMLQPLVPEGRLRQLLGTCAAGICGDGFVGARDDQLHWRDAGEDVMGWCDPGRRADHLGPGNLCRRAGWRFEEAYWRMLRGAGLLGEFLSSSRLVVIVPVACWVRPVPR
jgi:hypothetical protein